MDRKFISQRVGDALEEISRLTSALYAMNMTDIQRYPENYELLSMDAALRGEKLACGLRNLVFPSPGKLTQAAYLRAAGRTQGIHVELEKGTVTITLPGLLPKRKSGQDMDFLLNPLYFTLADLEENAQDFPHFERCTICFVHVYDQKLSVSRIRDYDNLELKQILDVACSFFLTDDSGCFCDQYQTTEMGESDATMLYIMENDCFSEWLAKRKQRE